MYPKELKYSVDHIWVKSTNNDLVKMGITGYYQKQLRKAIFVEVSKSGSMVKRGEPFGSIESSKTIGDLLSPVSGKVVEVNCLLDTNPGLTNHDPYGMGWMVVIEMNNLGELDSLMSAGEYELLTHQKPL